MRVCGKEQAVTVVRSLTIQATHSITNDFQFGQLRVTRTNENYKWDMRQSVIEPSVICEYTAELVLVVPVENLLVRNNSTIFLSVCVCIRLRF